MSRWSALKNDNNGPRSGAGASSGRGGGAYLRGDNRSTGGSGGGGGVSSSLSSSLRRSRPSGEPAQPPPTGDERRHWRSSRRDDPPQERLRRPQGCHSEQRGDRAVGLGRAARTGADPALGPWRRRAERRGTQQRRDGSTSDGSNRRIDDALTALRRALERLESLSAEEVEATDGVTSHGDDEHQPSSGGDVGRLVAAANGAVNEIASTIFPPPTSCGGGKTSSKRNEGANVSEDVTADDAGSALLLVVRCARDIGARSVAPEQQQNADESLTMESLDDALACRETARSAASTAHRIMIGFAGRGAVVLGTSADVRTCISGVLERIRQIIAPLSQPGATDASSVKDVTIGEDLLPLLRCLSAFVTAHGHTMQAEATARDVVGGVVLPVLDTDTYFGSDCKLEAMAILRRLFDYQHHTSAVLAPLVVDVSTNGEEVREANPLRMQVGFALQMLYTKDEEETDPLYLVGLCETLRSLMKAASLIDGADSAAAANGKKTAVSSPLSEAIVDAAAILKRVHQLLRAEVAGPGNGKQWTDEKILLLPHLLSLYRRTAQSFPRAAAGQWSLFMSERSEARSSNGGTGPSSRSPLLKKASAVSFMEIFDNASSDGDRFVALEAQKALLEALPLHLWLDDGARKQRKYIQTGSAASPTKSSFRRRGPLGDRVRAALLAVIEAVRDSFGAADRKRSAPEPGVHVVLLELSGVIFRKIPFREGDEDALMRPCSDILTSASNIMLTPGSNEASHAGVAFFLGCFGGEKSSQGRAKVLVGAWLRSSESDPFVGWLLDPAVQRTICGSEEKNDILCSVLRSTPHELLSHPSRIHSFLELTRSLSEDRNPSYRCQCMSLLESLFSGKNEGTEGDDSAKDHSFDVIAVRPMLLATLTDVDSSVRRHAAGVCAALSASDWQTVTLPGRTDNEVAEDPDMRVLNALLALCCGTCNCAIGEVVENGASVRSAACRAVGNACTGCIAHFGAAALDVTDSQRACLKRAADELCKIAADRMVRCLADRASSVRSMALFAVGNLALAIRERKGDDVVMYSEKTSSAGLFGTVFASLDDGDDKVVSNAIRSIGHVAFLHFHAPFRRYCRDGVADFTALVLALTPKIDTAIDAVVSGNASGMTWKKRSNAKKHAWGSCHSLALLLDAEAAVADEKARAASISALRVMLRCVEISDVLNEKKIALAALAALDGVPEETWSVLSCVPCTDSILGVGVATCLFAVDRRRDSVTSTKAGALEEGVSELLKRWLSFSSTADLQSFLSQDTVSPRSIEFLYGWMIDNGCNGGVFVKFVESLDRSDMALAIDVSVLQRFRSRASHAQRLAGTLGEECSDVSSVCDSGEGIGRLVGEISIEGDDEL